MSFIFGGKKEAGTSSTGAMRPQQQQPAPASSSASDRSSSPEEGVLVQKDHAPHDEMKVKVYESVLQEDYLSKLACNNKAAKKSGTEQLIEPKLIGAIDQGTSSTRFLVFTDRGRIAASAQKEHEQIFPKGEDKVGWHEHDPLEIWNNTVECMDAVDKALREQGLTGSSTGKGCLSAVGITNQRETTVAWNLDTGVPYYNAIVWDDTRTTDIAAAIAAGDINRLRAKTGLPLASYFAGTKVRWMLDNVPELQRDLKNETTRNQVAFGTIDTWLMYQLTGKKQKQNKKQEGGKNAAAAANVGGVFLTDVTNASRWLFMDLRTQTWDAELIKTVCGPHDLPAATALPKICPSSYEFCPSLHAADAGLPAALVNHVPLGAVLGDQQAALFGQAAFEPGQAKNTYGTGLFLMMHTGSKPIASTHGLLTTVAYQIGTTGEVQYALEGSVSHSGSTIQWLRDKMRMLDDASQSEALAASVPHNDGMYLVPAFAGLFAPHWRADARACMVGMTASHEKRHVVRAALEAAAYQTREVFEAITADASVRLQCLYVDGGATANDLLMQFQADMLQVPVVKPAVMETTAMGAACCAGLTVGVWKDLGEIQKMWTMQRTYAPRMSQAEREKNWKGWKKAVTKSLGWVNGANGTSSSSSSEEDNGGGDDDDDAMLEDVEEYQDALSSLRASMKRNNKDDDDDARLHFSVAVIAGTALVVGYLMGSSLSSRRSSSRY